MPRDLQQLIRGPIEDCRERVEIAGAPVAVEQCLES
jgi:hypothetical protein